MRDVIQHPRRPLWAFLCLFALLLVATTGCNTTPLGSENWQDAPRETSQSSHVVIVAQPESTLTVTMSDTATTIETADTVSGEGRADQSSTPTTTTEVDADAEADLTPGGP